jgi:hypothetical protein
MKKAPDRIPVLDLNLSAFQRLHGNSPQLVLQAGRVIFMFDADATFYRLSELYNSNIAVNCLDLVNAQRELRAMMMSLKGQHTENAKGFQNGHETR